MAVFRPFKALRPAEKLAAEVVSLPYDVMNREEATEMAEGKPYSYLHICRSEIDMPEEDDIYAKSVYIKANENLLKFIDKGVFVREEKPIFYVYRQTMDGRTQTGFVGCASIDEYLNGTIKKHELTRVEKEQDRINQFDYCNGNTEPVFFTYKDKPEIAKLLAEITDEKPLFDIVDENNVGHILWRVGDDAVINKITELFDKEIDYMYIADGHHRSASAVKVGLMRREEYPNYTGEEEFNFFMACVFPDTDMAIFDYNRVVKDLNGYSPEELLKIIGEKFTVEKYKGFGQYRPASLHEFGMYLEGSWYKMAAKEGTYNSEDPIDSLDVSILQNNLLAPVLGIGDPRTDKRIDFVGGIRGLAELEKRVKNGYKIAFALYPVSIDQLIAVADAGLLMPPKSTWFEPKLGSGLFIHEY